MGLKDFFSRKKTKEVEPPVTKMETKQHSYMDAYRNSYDLFLEGLDDLKDFCTQNGVSYEQTLADFKIEVPASFEEFAANFEAYSDSVLTNIPNAKAAIKQKVKEEERQAQIANKPVSEISNAQQQHNANSEYLRTVKIQSETETGKVVDGFYDKAEKAYNDSRLDDYAKNSLDEFEQIFGMMNDTTEEKGRTR